MARFCGTCGNPLQETSAFCGACGARVPQAGVTPVAMPVSPVPPVSSPPPVKTGTSPVVKIILVVVLLLVVLGSLSVAGIFYAVHLASRKAHELSRQVRETGLLSALPDDSGASGGSDLPAGTLGPGACRFLSKEEVGQAIGVAIVAAKTTMRGCEYLAQGTAGDMTAKHIAAMMASKGATAQQQQMFQSLSRGLLGSAQSQAEGSGPPVNTVVMAFTIDPNAAKTQMSTNENVFVLGAMGPGAKPLTGIGDEAFDASGSVMMVRKGDKLIRITYSTCPCTIDAIKPLAQRLVASL
jgi:hypothetical protein